MRLLDELFESALVDVVDLRTADKKMAGG
jgi:hypothetical protein